MKSFLPVFRKSFWIVAVCLAMLPGCGRGKGRVLEVMYVSAPQGFLRDRVAAVYNKVATVKNGDRLDVLDREKRFVKV
ncbi:MAG: SH3 domain-containing protein, partial [Acidobacteria bacterium]